MRKSAIRVACASARALADCKEISMSTVFNIIAILFMLAVLTVLIRGLVNLMRGGSGNTSNKLMQARVILQFFALVFILLAVWATRN
jgi:hypothetical protein